MYDPIDDLWSEAVEGMMMPHEREKHNMIAVGSSKIFFIAGRGFDQETFSEKDESEVCHYNLGGHEGIQTGTKPLWDTEHPCMLYPHSNGAAILLGFTTMYSTVPLYANAKCSCWRVGTLANQTRKMNRQTCIWDGPGMVRSWSIYSSLMGSRDWCSLREGGGGVGQGAAGL
ncbi:hypothetical protein BaRGS_00025222 [Batillaria attramentaria]|uniref:Uncharacterized protein n=1 Tax=Batillaria attramentaria TaxID=370345 RepID=A0ABD0K906_9CAEN